MDDIQTTPDPINPGRFIVTIPVYSSPGNTVTLFKEDHDRLVHEYGLRNLHIRTYDHNRYVVFKTKAPVKELPLARFILGFPKGRQVSTIDSDCLNLRRSNLVHRSGGAGGMKRSSRSSAPRQQISDREAMRRLQEITEARLREPRPTAYSPPVNSKPVKPERPRSR